MALTLDSPSILTELKQVKFNLIQHARKQKFAKTKAEARNTSQIFIDSRKIWAQYLNNKKAGKYDNAFYMLHLYLRIVLEFSLHRRKEAEYAKVTKEALNNLLILEKDLGVMLANIKKQLLKKQQQELAKLNAAERKKKQEEEAEAERQRLIKEEAERIQAEKRKEEFQNAAAAQVLAAATAAAAAQPQIGADLGPPPAYAPPAYPGKADVPPPAYPSLANVEATAPPTNTVNVSAPPVAATPVHVDRSRVEGTEEPRQSVEPASAFSVQRVQGDGHCAFRSLVQGMNVGRLDSTQEHSLAVKLRKLVVKELLNARSDEMMDTGLTVEQVITMDTSSKFDNFGDYLRGMSQKSYAGEVEFWIISKVLGIKIAVWQPEGSNYRHLVTYGHGQVQPVNLLWQKGTYGEGGNHYDVLHRR